MSNVVFDRPFYVNFVKKQIDLEAQLHDIEVVYRFYAAQFTPTLDMIKTLKLANNAGQASYELYQEAMSNFTEWYNDKYGKDIDISYVENRIRAQESKNSGVEGVNDSELRAIEDKNHLELSEVIRYERTKQTG